MKSVTVVIGAGSIGQAIARRVSAGKHVLLAVLRKKSIRSEALRVFERNPSIDVVLTDVAMPGASGPELVTQLVARRPTLKVQDASA
jgi:CheY-like chemotaxis protein